MKRSFVVIGALGVFASSVSSMALAAAYPVFCQISSKHAAPPAPNTEFSFRARAAGGQPPYSFQWVFGDGGTSTDQNPNHDYGGAANIFQVVMTVTDSDLPAASCSDTLYVPSRVAVDPGCIASADLTWGVAPLTVQFSGDPALFETDSYSWDFGDGTGSILQHPTHTYSDWGTYYVKLYGAMSPYPPFECQPVHRVTALPSDALGVESPRALTGVQLRQPTPNPFTRGTTFTFDLPRVGRARLRIFDTAGRLVATLFNGQRAAGTQTEPWTGGTDDGAATAPGLYFATLEFEGAARAVRLVRMR